jgi:alginate O-acetyltransferase complex protein AlgI
MQFDSYSFLLFFGLVLAVHASPLSWSSRKSSLLIASYLFYAAWNPPFVLLLFGSTLADWFVARWIASSASQARRRALLVVSLCINLGVLGFFKYGGFVLENFVALLALVGVDYRPAAPSLVLPVGISFYTFQTLSYTIDVYRDRARPWHSFLDYALYVSFFPQLVAGPIVRSSTFLPQCESERRASGDQLGRGMALLVLGLFMKVVVADGLMAPVSEQVFAPGTATDFRSASLGTLASATSRATRPARSGRPSAWASSFRSTSTSPTRPLASRTSGVDGTSRSRRGFATISTSRSGAIAPVCLAPGSI